MKKLFLLAFAITSIGSLASELDYNHQEKWQFISGKSQSPININTKDVVTPVNSLGKIKLYYNNNIVETIKNNGHSINVDTKGNAVINNRVFALKSFHLHSPSEHTLDGKYFPIEIHFVHQAEDGQIAVIGIFAKEGEENPEFQKVLDNVKKGKSNIDLEKLFPETKEYYHYLGSLTTPPLSETVEWYVLKNPITLSKKQIEEFNKYYKGNNRKVQELNGRKILLGK